LADKSAIAIADRPARDDYLEVRLSREHIRDVEAVGDDAEIFVTQQSARDRLIGGADIDKK
jgi:hypothetical protein